jgi:hypothetical protein
MVAPKDDCKITQLAAVTTDDAEKAMITSPIRIGVKDPFVSDSREEGCLALCLLQPVLHSANRRCQPGPSHPDGCAPQFSISVGCATLLSTSA